MLTATQALQAVLEGSPCTQSSAQDLATRVRQRFLVLLSQPDVGMEGLQQELTNEARLTTFV